MMIEDYPHLWMPGDAITFDLFAAITVAPATAQLAVISPPIRTGYKGWIKGIDLALGDYNAGYYTFLQAGQSMQFYQQIRTEMRAETPITISLSPNTPFVLAVSNTGLANIAGRYRLYGWQVPA